MATMSKPVPVREIVDERLALWAKRLNENNATPAVLLGIGHDRTSGQIVVCTVEDFTNDELRYFLAYALKELS